MKYHFQTVLLFIILMLQASLARSEDLPQRGMFKSQVASTWGAPLKKIAAVGHPPISRWVYAGFIVYFQDNFVIDSVLTPKTPANTTAQPGKNSGS